MWPFKSKYNVTIVEAKQPVSPTFYLANCDKEDRAEALLSQRIFGEGTEPSFHQEGYECGAFIGQHYTPHFLRGLVAGFNAKQQAGAKEWDDFATYSSRLQIVEAEE